MTLADVGLEAASLDRSADPCVDFYQFACGGWIRANPVPPDLSRYTRRIQTQDQNIAKIAALLDVAARPGETPEREKLGAFYASCMDEAAIERAELVAFAPLLAQTRGVKDARTWLAALIQLHKLGIYAVWDHHVAPDLKSSTRNVTYLDAAGLGLPDRGYYADARLRDKLDGYRAQVGKLLELLPPGPGKLDAGDVIAIETELARLTRTATERRDVASGYNPTDLRGLAHQVASVDWAAYWKGLGTAPSAQIILGTPRFFAGLDALRARFTPAQWASYFTYHLVQNLAFAMPRALDHAAFDRERLVSGVLAPRARDQRCIDRTTDALGDLIGQAYVTSEFPASSKQRVTRIVDAVVQALTDDIAGLPWMADATRRAATAKLGQLVRMIGYPDHWLTYDFKVDRGDFAGNALRAAAFAVHRELARAGQPVDRDEWQMPVYQVDGYYNQSANNTALPAGLLQPPLFGQDHAVAVNLGAIGSMIGHELTHGFDDRGAQFDGDGNLVDWWQPDDRARFAQRSTCVAEQYAGFEAVPGEFIQGKLTLSENIADLGGAKLAFLAYRALRSDAAKYYIADGFTEDQQFFLAAAQAWCATERPAETERRLTVDPHSPPKFRIFGSLRNLPAFAEAFSCPAGTPMHPANRCVVW